MLRPEFWVSRQVPSGNDRHSLNLRRLWKLTVLIMSVVAIGPLLVVTGADYKVTQESIESEILLRTSRIVSNTKRSVQFSLVERMSALDFIVQDNSYEELSDCDRLTSILERLQKSFKGFVDLGVIDSDGRQACYVGPYELAGVNYLDQEWFRNVVDQGMHISDVFSGFRRVPHLVIAARHEVPGGGFYVLRTSLEADFFNQLLSGLELSGDGDAFIVNRQGILQTSSRRHGAILDRIELGMPRASNTTVVNETLGPHGEQLIVGYSYIPETPFVLMIVKQKPVLMQAWRTTRRQLLFFLAISITGILVATLGVTTYLVDRIYWADLRRVATLHRIEYTNKMASLGRLGAGVAHEINNPLAIINEKAGLIKDLFTFTDHYANDAKLMAIVNSILSSVERCSTITRRLLGFARSAEVESSPVDLKSTIKEVLGFMGKEAEYRSINVTMEIDDLLPPIQTNRGKLQQILLNLVNNAFAAVKDGGAIAFSASQNDQQSVTITVSDNGCGMTKHELKRIFEPFFTTKAQAGGTGLGLSITYSLVQELGGSISVDSEPEQGTTFTITLPLHGTPKEAPADAGLTR